MAISSIKQITLELLEKLPHNSSQEEIMYQVYLAGQIYEGLQDVKDNRVITTDELLHQISLWKKNNRPKA